MACRELLSLSQFWPMRRKTGIASQHVGSPLATEAGGTWRMKRTLTAVLHSRRKWACGAVLRETNVNSAFIRKGAASIGFPSDDQTAHRSGRSEIGHRCVIVPAATMSLLHYVIVTFGREQEGLLGLRCQSLK
jgi:hypothetical protein